MAAPEFRALYSADEARSLIDRWETTGGPTTTEVTLAWTVLALYDWNEWVGQRHSDMDALWDEWIRFQRGVHPDYEPSVAGQAPTFARGTEQ